MTDTQNSDSGSGHKWMWVWDKWRGFYHYCLCGAWVKP
jgi:hypothetical protein